MIYYEALNDWPHSHYCFSSRKFRWRKKARAEINLGYLLNSDTDGFVRFSGRRPDVAITVSQVMMNHVDLF